MQLLRRIFGRANSADSRDLRQHRQPCSSETLPWRSDTSSPIVDWAQTQKLAPSEDPTAAEEHWWAVALAWLNTLGASLGPQYAVAQSNSFAVLSSLKGRQLDLVIECCERYRARILRTLNGIANDGRYGPHVVLIFDSIDEYYGYIGNYYPKQGEFAMSSGVFLQHGYGHFVFQASDMSAMEPIIAHELTHCLVASLPIPAWLNEGTAVNMEQVLAPRAADPRRGIFTHRDAAKKRSAFWNEHTIQEFWSGKSFKRPDEGCELSYELATELTSLIAKDHERYRTYMNAAHWKDAGNDAAPSLLGITLGELTSAVLGHGAWEPDPSRWREGTELGQFRPAHRPLAKRG